MKIYRPINSKDLGVCFLWYDKAPGNVSISSWRNWEILLVWANRRHTYYKILENQCEREIIVNTTAVQLLAFYLPSRAVEVMHHFLFRLSFFNEHKERRLCRLCLQHILILFEKCQFYRPSSSKCFTTQSFLEFSSWNRKWEKWSVHRSFRGRGVTPVVVSART